MRALIYDTETTGLPSNWKASIDDISAWPSIVQMAWSVVDTDQGLVESERSEIFRLSPGVRVTPDSEAIHGISAALCAESGKDPALVLAAFTEAARGVDVLVCHNAAFDRPVVTCEALRYGDCDLAGLLMETGHFCTMLAGVDICKIAGRYGYKWPKLQELHGHYFGKGFEGAHDAMADVRATARCFMEMARRGEVSLSACS